jgi:hypothetical protein
MATTYQRRCSLCGQFVASQDREALLEEHRLEWDEAMVDDFIAGSRHICIDTDPHGARASARLIEAGLIAPELRWLIEAELERRQAAGQPAWTVFTTAKGATVMATTKVVRCPAGCLHPVGDHSPEPVVGRVGCCADSVLGRCPCTWAPRPKDSDRPAVVQAGSPEHMATFTDDQLRTLASSTNPAHIAHGFAAECELILREARRQASED